MPEYYIPLLAFGGFVAFWTILVTVISRLGWGKLADRFAAVTKPSDGKTYWGQSARIGISNYNGCVNVRVCVRGLYLTVFPVFRPGHPPVLIPWHAIRNVTEKGRLGFTSYVLEVGQPLITTIEIRKTLLERIEERHQLHRKQSQKFG